MAKKIATYETEHKRLTALGFYLNDTSPSGSRYYVALNKPYIRVSDHAPNAATSAWMSRNNVTDIRVKSDFEVAAVDEQETGYHFHPAWSRTDLAVLASDGPRTFEAFYIKKSHRKPDPTIAMKIGSCTHQQVLEPHLEDNFIIIPRQVLSEGGRRQGTAWKKFEEEHAGKVLLKEDEAEEMLGSVKSLRSNLWFLIEDANALREHELYWTHSRTGLSLRCKLDLLATYKDDLVIPDLKTCADNERFPDQVKRSKLWLQVAHYRAGVKHHYQREALFWFAVVEKSPPFKVWHYMLDEYALKLADEKYEALLDELKRRIDDNDWAEPGEDGIQLTVKDCFGWEG